MGTYNWAFQVLMHHEGGFVNHAADPGGATNFGISLRYLQARGDLDGDGVLDGDLDGDGVVDVSDIRRMTTADAKALYANGFWKPAKCPQIKSELIAVKVFDMAVNMGQRQAYRIVQRALNSLQLTELAVDGIVGPATLNAINDLERRDYKLLTAIRKEQKQFYADLIERKPELDAFRLGWYRRACA